QRDRLHSVPPSDSFTSKENIQTCSWVGSQFSSGQEPLTHGNTQHVPYQNKNGCHDHDNTWYITARHYGTCAGFASALITRGRAIYEDKNVKKKVATPMDVNAFKRHSPGTLRPIRTRSPAASMHSGPHYIAGKRGYSPFTS
ncbi:unnamed protein product, partial [Ectocarpus sp. 6 AP-2014]